jgi:hypothetical protein
MNTRSATLITLAFPTSLLLPMLLNAHSNLWHPSGSEAAGFIFVSFALIGVLVTILAFPVTLNFLVQKGLVSFRLFLVLSCFLASTAGASAFFLYPVLTSMQWSNFDPTLVIGVVVIQCLVAIPLAALWWWLAKPHNISVNRDAKKASLFRRPLP